MPARAGRFLLCHVLPRGAAAYLAAFFLAVATAGPVVAQKAPVDPELVAAAASVSKIVPEEDFYLLNEAYEELAKRHYDDLDLYLPMFKTAIAHDLWTWQLIIHPKTELPFGEVIAFADAHPDWPMRSRVLARAEEAMDANLTAEQVVAWFAGREPITGQGKIRLGAALIETGAVDFGRAWIKKAWTEHDFETDEQAEILKVFQAILDKKTQKARLDRLLWERKYTLAEKIMPLVEPADRTYAETRIKLVRGALDPMTVLDKVPFKQRSDDGIWFDRAYAARRFGKEEDAWTILLQAPARVPTIHYPNRWWDERHLQARKAHKEQNYDTAYRVAAHNNLERGVDFAEAEFLSGWLALRYLNDPKKARAHFETLAAGVGSPISLARGHYWAGRAAEAEGDNQAAKAHYADAAQFSYTFYGQLAAEHPLVAAGNLRLPNLSPSRDALREGFQKHSYVTAIRLAQALDLNFTVRRFFIELADNAETPEQYALLADLARELAYPNLSVRVAKIAMQKHFLIAEHAYPLIALPAYRGKHPAPEPALVYGLTRQESEMNPEAVSHAGARGLMQLMPGTAKLTAKLHGMLYNRRKLTEDPDYNLSLGMAHLGDLLERFDGSYIMTIAAYNAGARRVDQWAQTYGDPRLPGVDPIDWIESIPYSETRNYVQRVMENVQVYRTRVAGVAQPLRLSADLGRMVPSAVKTLDEAALAGDDGTRQAQADDATDPGQETQ